MIDIVGIVQVLASLSALVLAIVALRKSNSEAKKTKAEGLHEDASAAEIFQKMLTEETENRKKTMATMQVQIDKLIEVGHAYEAQIKELTITLASEQAARRELEATVVRLNNELAAEKKERLEALAALATLKVWAENFMAWAEHEQLTARLKELGIIPIPFAGE